MNVDNGTNATCRLAAGSTGESTFATVRHGTTCSRNCLSRATFLGLAFKLMEEAEKSWRKIRGADKIGLLLACVSFKDGPPVQGNPPEQQKLSA